MIWRSLIPRLEMPVTSADTVPETKVGGGSGLVSQMGTPFDRSTRPDCPMKVRRWNSVPAKETRKLSHFPRNCSRAGALTGRGSGAVPNRFTRSARRVAVT
jgi:hypothetical protein